MNQRNNQKLVSMSKKMVFFLRVFSIFLIVIALVPWIAPTSGAGSFLMGMYGVPRFATMDFEQVIPTLTPLTWILGFTGTLITLLPLFMGTFIMLKLSGNYAKGIVFNLYNAKSYSRLGLLYFLSALLLQPLSHVFFSLAATLNNPPGQRMIGISFTTENLTAIFFALILIVIGQVMTWGQKISEEQELTV